MLTVKWLHVLLFLVGLCWGGKLKHRKQPALRKPLDSLLPSPDYYTSQTKMIELENEEEKRAFLTPETEEASTFSVIPRRSMQDILQNRPTTQLVKAIRTNNLTRVQEIVTNHTIDLNRNIVLHFKQENQEDPLTPLGWALREDAMGIAYYLIKQGAKTANSDMPKLTLLQMAARNNANLCLELLLRLGHDPNIYWKGLSPLFISFQFDNVDAIELLLQAGALWDQGLEFEAGISNMLIDSFITKRNNIAKHLIVHYLPNLDTTLIYFSKFKGMPSVEMNPVYMAIVTQNLVILDFMLDRGIHMGSLSAEQIYGDSPFHVLLVLYSNPHLNFVSKSSPSDRIRYLKDLFALVEAKDVQFNRTEFFTRENEYGLTYLDTALGLELPSKIVSWIQKETDKAHYELAKWQPVNDTHSSTPFEEFWFQSDSRKKKQRKPSRQKKKVKVKVKKVNTRLESPIETSTVESVDATSDHENNDLTDETRVQDTTCTTYDADDEDSIPNDPILVVPQPPPPPVMMPLSTEQHHTFDLVSRAISASKYLENILETKCSCSARGGLVTKINELASRGKKSAATDAAAVASMLSPMTHFTHALHIGSLRNMLVHRLYRINVTHAMSEFQDQFIQAVSEVYKGCGISKSLPSPETVLHRWSLYYIHIPDLALVLYASHTLSRVLEQEYQCDGLTLQEKLDCFSVKSSAFDSKQVHQDLKYLNHHRNHVLHRLEQTRLEDGRLFESKFIQAHQGLLAMASVA